MHPRFARVDGRRVARLTGGMTELPIPFETPVTLAGGGTLDRAMLEQSLALAPVLVAADGAADILAGLGHLPDLVIGDMDSITDPAAWKAGPSGVVHLAEQETTDFEKCLTATVAPFYVGVGFTGGRVDHMLAVLHAMLRHPEKQTLLIGEVEAMALLPARRPVELSLAPGETVSLYPLVPVRGVRSTGLVWPIDGLEFAPGRQIGTSNRAETVDVTVEVDGPGMLILAPRHRLNTLVGAVAATSAVF